MFPGWLFNNIETSVAIISIILAILAIIIAKINLSKKDVKSLKKINESMPYFSKTELFKLTKSYVKLHGQNTDPRNDDGSIRYDINQTLSKFICNELPNKYFFLLGEAGSGKTSALIMAMHNYFIERPTDHEIMYISMMSGDVFKQIESISTPEKTILILDGLDENSEIISNPNVFLQNLESRTKHFYKIIISCRTYFYYSFKNLDEIFIETSSKDGKQMMPYKIFILPLTEAQRHEFLKKLES